MPLYTYECECGQREDAYRSIDGRNDPLTCKCGGEMKKIITPAQVDRYFLGSTDNPGYECPITNRWITNKRDRLNIMKEHGVIEAK